MKVYKSASRSDTRHSGFQLLTSHNPEEHLLADLACQLRAQPLTVPIPLATQPTVSVSEVIVDPERDSLAMHWPEVQPLENRMATEY